MNDERKAMIAAALAYGIFGLSFLFSKIALEITQPAVLLCLRFSLTVLLLNVMRFFAPFRISFQGKKRTLLWAPVLLGLIQPVLYFYLENYGLKYTTTSFTGMVAAISPIFTALAGVLVLRERPNGRQWLFMALSIAGVLMVSLQTVSSGENTLLGCVCLVGAYASGALYSLLVRRLTRVYTPFELTYVMFTVGFVFFLGHVLVEYRAGAFVVLGEALSHGQFIAAVLYLGGLSSVGAYMLVNYSLAKLTVARSTIFSCASTVMSVLAGVLIMHDSFSLLSLFAFVCILAGVWGVNRFATDGRPA
ncbi:MAG: DMT family transporter [Eubacteriales bacterium]|nr:DMT family transporter [Eubacteriales bacterium]